MSLRRISAALLHFSSLCMASTSFPLLARTGTNGSYVVESDIIFPRNETYLATEILPIAINVQHYHDAPKDIISTGWILASVGLNRYVTGISLDTGTFDIYNGTTGSNDSSSAIFVSYTNVTKWLPELRYGEQIVLFTMLSWEADDICGSALFDAPISGTVEFTLAPLDWLTNNTDGRQFPFTTVNTTLNGTVAGAPDCPAVGALITAKALPPSVSSAPLPLTTTDTYISPVSTILSQGDPDPVSTEYLTKTTTRTCVSTLIQDYTGTPCKATIGASVRSEIDKAISSKAFGTLVGNGTAPTATATSTSKNAAALARPTGLAVGPALAVAGVLYGIM